MKYFWMLDAGHGGIDAKGNYVTAPKKMFDHGNFKIYEGQINRMITSRLSELLRIYDIRHTVINDPIEDTPLSERLRRANEVYNNDNSAIFLSIHSNAGGGKGFEVFTSVGQTRSDIVAQYFADSYKSNFPGMRFRSDLSDGDDDKESQFFVLRKTSGPAVLVENLFFDNRKEAEFLLSEQGQRQIASALCSAIMRMENDEPF